MATAGSEPQVLEVSRTTTAVIKGVVALAELPGFFDRSFSTLTEVLGSQGVAITGIPFAMYHSPPTDVADLEVGVPTDRQVEPQQGVEASALPGGRVARVVHAGSYESLGASWERLGAWLGEQGLTPGDAAWEVYTTEPRPDMDPADLRTEINWLLT